MSVLLSEVNILREQLAAKEAIIEQQKREAKEKEEQSWEYNLNFIQCDTRVVAAQSETRPYRGESAGAKYAINQARQRAPFMQAVLNCLKRIDERLKKLELQ